MRTQSPQFFARQRLLAALRDPATVQCRNELGAWDKDTGPVCFNGLLFRLYIKDTNCSPSNIIDLPRSAIPSHFGLPIHPKGMTCEWFHLNDRGWTFAQLADKVEAQPLETPSS